MGVVLGVLAGLAWLAGPAVRPAQAAPPERPAQQSNWGTVTVGLDASGHYFATLENSQIKVRYGYYLGSGVGQTAIREFRLKTAGNQNMIGSGDYVDASASSARGELTNALVKYDGADYKSVWLEWDYGTGREVQEVAIFPDSLYLQIDYFRYGLNIVDLAGISSGTYEFYGNACWLDCVTPRGYTAYPGSYYNRWPGDGINDPADAGALNNGGYFVGGVFNSTNGRGFGRVMPVAQIDIVKLLFNRGLEWFPNYLASSRPAYRGYLYGITGGAAETLATGQQIVNQASPIPSTYNLTVLIEPLGAGSVDLSHNQVFYTANQVITLTAQPNPGYTFVRWTGARTSTANPVDLLMSSSKTITAVFAHQGYSLNVSTSGSGSVSRTPSQPTYANGDVVTLTATPDPGWNFAGWTGDLTGEANPAAVVMNSPRSIQAVFTTAATGSWWNYAWHFRVPIQISAAGFERVGRPAEVNLNFPAQLAALGRAGTFAPSSLRVAEVNSQGVILNPAVNFQFDDPNGDGSGTLILMLDGRTPAGGTRRFHVYFDTVANGPFTPLSVAPQLTVTDNISDAGQLSFQVDTLNATYFYQKQGAGFSSLVDRSGQDWISYQPGYGSAGEYRGIPNSGDNHPGYTSSVSSLVTVGPLKAVITSTDLTGQWRYQWEMFPNFTRLTVLQTGGNYWLLYEGTPFGQLDKRRDYFTLSDGISRTVGTDRTLTWNADIPGPEWVYFGDSYADRVLFMAHHEDDALGDTFWQMDDNMTVFGFGRLGNTCSPCAPLMSSVPQHFTLGLAENVHQSEILLNSAYRDLGVTVSAPEEWLGPVPPTIAPVGDRVLYNGSLLSLTVSASDLNGDPVTYFGSSLPAGATLNPASGLFNWTPTIGQVGVNAVTVGAGDGVLSSTLTFTVTVNNRAPTLNALASQAVYNGSPINFSVSGSDPDGNALIYSAAGWPAGATLNAATGAFSWTPTIGQVGSHVITFIGTDGLLTDTEVMTITVNNRAPALTAPAPQAVYNGSALNLTLSGSDPDGNALTYSASGLPAGATVAAATGAFNWTPTLGQVGVHAITVSASDGLLSASQVLTITVGNRAPALTAIGNKVRQAGQSLDFTVGGSDPDGNTLTYSASGLPAGAALNAATGAFSWTPSIGQAGDHQITFTASDGLLTDAETITVTVSLVPVTGAYQFYVPYITR